MKILSARRFGLWWKLAQRWFRQLLNDAVATIIAAMPKETTEEQIDSMFE